MFDFLKPKNDKPLLFTIQVQLDPYDEHVMNQKNELFKIKPSGTATSLGKYAGTIPLWQYISQFDKPTTMRRVAFNKFDIDVHGEADRSLVVAPVDKRPYSYDCVLTDHCPYMLPETEYLCTLAKSADHFDVAVNGSVIGVLEDRKKRGTIDKVAKMLDYGWRTTAVIYPNCTAIALEVKIVKA